MKIRTGVLLALATASCLLLAGCSAAPVERLAPPSADQLDLLSPEASYEQHREGLIEIFARRYPGVEIPQVDPVRFVLPEEWAPTMVDCLQAAGFGARELGDGGIGFDEVPETQAAALELANLNCNLLYPPDPKFSSPMSAYQVEYLYEYFLYDLVPCLEAEGFDVPDAPSRQRFIEAYETQDGWSPYAFVQTTTDAAWSQINRTCPQMPEDLFG